MHNKNQPSASSTLVNNEGIIIIVKEAHDNPQSVHFIADMLERVVDSSGPINFFLERCEERLGILQAEQKLKEVSYIGRAWEWKIPGDMQFTAAALKALGIEKLQKTYSNLFHDPKLDKKGWLQNRAGLLKILSSQNVTTFPIDYAEKEALAEAKKIVKDPASGENKARIGPNEAAASERQMATPKSEWGAVEDAWQARLIDSAENRNTYNEEEEKAEEDYRKEITKSLEFLGLKQLLEEYEKNKDISVKHNIVSHRALMTSRDKFFVENIVKSLKDNPNKISIVLIGSDHDIKQKLETANTGKNIYIFDCTRSQEEKQNLEECIGKIKTFEKEAPNAGTSKNCYTNFFNRTGKPVIIVGLAVVAGLILNYSASIGKTGRSV